MFQTIQSAYACLSDPDERDFYDRNREAILAGKTPPRHHHGDVSFEDLFADLFGGFGGAGAFGGFGGFHFADEDDDDGGCCHHRFEVDLEDLFDYVAGYHDHSHGFYDDDDDYDDYDDYSTDEDDDETDEFEPVPDLPLDMYLVVRRDFERYGPLEVRICPYIAFRME